MYITLIIQLEVLLINLYITNLISIRKYSMRKTIGLLLLYTCLIVLFAFFARTENTTEWLNIIIGLSYILPLTLIYKESMIKMSTIMFFAWTQTMIISNISLALGSIINDNFIYLTIIIQSVVFIIAIPFIKKFALQTYKVILEGISKESFNLLLALATLLLILSIVVNYSISNPVLTIMSLMLLGLSCIFVYNLLHAFVVKSNKVIALNKIAYTDLLTQTGNRLSLFTSTNSLIENNQSFQCVFMDLDDLKSINDTFGHNVGDQYLVSFTNAVIKSIGDGPDLFRIAGDEFVCIFKNTSVNLDDLKSKIAKNFESDIEFNGVSMGLSTFPFEGKTLDKLLIVADSKMYGLKQSKKIRNQNRKNQD